MMFDPQSSDITIISYPSGGFGNFIYHVLTEFADGTVKVPNQGFHFQNGNSHNTVKYTSVYYHDPEKYDANLAQSVAVSDKNILVLCDNGINNDQYHKVNQTFPHAKIVRMCIDPRARPVVYQTCVLKAMRSQLHLENELNMHAWSDADEPYAQRENFTLLYHNWPFAWQPHPDCINIDISQLLIDPVTVIQQLIADLNMHIIRPQELHQLCDRWTQENLKFCNIMHQASDIMHALTHDIDLDVSNITDLHDQGYINHRIEQQYHVTIPVYDYRHWFKNTADIQTMVHQLTHA